MEQLKKAYDASGHLSQVPPVIEDLRSTATLRLLYLKTDNRRVNLEDRGLIRNRLLSPIVAYNSEESSSR
nr:hypothetical protein HmN_000962800 [Hymenolepis microstoma]